MSDQGVRVLKFSKDFVVCGFDCVPELSEWAVDRKVHDHCSYY